MRLSEIKTGIAVTGLEPAELVCTVMAVNLNEDDSVDGHHYITKPFNKEPDWGAASVNYLISELLRKGARQEAEK